jgi:hypothetical protein
VRIAFYIEQKGSLNQCVAMLYPEISRENRDLPTGTFGTEIKGRPMKTLMELFTKYQWLEERIGRGLPIPISKERQQVSARRLRRRRSAHIAELPPFRYQQRSASPFLVHCLLSQHIPAFQRYLPYLPGSIYAGICIRRGIQARSIRHEIQRLQIGTQPLLFPI